MHGRSPDENNVGLANVLASISGEEKVPPASCLDDLEKARLVNGQVVGVPCLDPLLVDVDNDHLDLRALQGDHSHRWACEHNMKSDQRVVALTSKRSLTSHIASSDASNLHVVEK
jgi:hypothetical protein